MIASHDFERKVGDVMRYLDRGDVVKVKLLHSFFLNVWVGWHWAVLLCDAL